MLFVPFFNHHYLVTAILLVIGVLVFNVPSFPDQGSTTATDIGERATTELMTTLKRELMGALKQGGPAVAISVCAEKAQALTAAIPEKIGYPGITIKRTSLRYRNPGNRPDEEEEAILDEFERLKGEGREIGPRLVQGTDRFRHYTPIVTSGLCLACHGEEERIPSEVKEVLGARYPMDRATDFKAGDLRGIVSVTIPVQALQHNR